MSEKLEEMTVEDICDWLKARSDIPDSVVDAFRDEYLDGNAIAIGLSTTPGPDWLKDVVSKVGLRLKVHSALRTLYNESQSRASPSPLTPSDSVSNPSPTLPSTESVYSSESSSSTPMRCHARKSTHESCPNPFPIPKFRSSTEVNFKMKVLTDSDRKYVVQTLATMLMTHVSHPSLKCCGIVAKALIEKFDFLKDGEGDGDHSWKWFVYYRCQNVNRHGSQKIDGAPPRKQLKLHDWAMHSYPPPVNADDIESYQKNLSLLNAELSKPKPRTDVLKMLMTRTFNNRFQELLSGDKPVSARDHVTKYPLLKKPAYAALEFCSVVNSDAIRDTFEENFPKWSRAVIYYCKETQIRSTAIQQECVCFSDDMDDEYCALTAIRCLCLLLVPMKTKKLDENVPFILKVVPHGTPTSESPSTTAHISGISRVFTTLKEKENSQDIELDKCMN